MKNKKEVIKVIAASLLGDGWIDRERTNNSRFCIELREDHRDHLEYLAEYLSFITRTTFKLRDGRSKVINDIETTSKPIWSLRSMNHPQYTIFRERMYLNRVKVVDPHYLTLLDAEFLAVWYQQDGYLEQDSQRIRLCTENFSYGDHVLLRRAIIERTGFIFNIIKRGLNKNNEQTYRLNLNTKQRELFIDTILPYIQPSFLYKANIERQDAKA